MTPSISMMLRLLPQNEQSYVTKQKVINLESEIVRLLDFDFNFISPLFFLERFLRLAEL
jgi:hypothetical protein